MTEVSGQKSEVSKILALRHLLLALSFSGAMLFSLTFPAQAQQSKKVHRIGYLGATDPAGESTRFEAIRLALRELGYIEGQNIAFEYRYAEGKQDRYLELAAELVRLKVDIIVVAGGPGRPERPRMRPKPFPSL
jgi:ABC-type uncharacterized transport system substrate-binding protein